MSHSARRSMRFESLELRQLLAGDVVVSVVEGNLFIRGDELGNQIAVSSGDEPGSFVIRGLDGTNVKMAGSDEGAPESGLVVTGVRGHVHVNLDGGDDAVMIADAHFRRGLSINTGAGADLVRIGAPPETPAPAGEGDPAPEEGANVTVRGSLLIRTGADDDRVRIGSANVGGVIGVSTDGGNDSVLLGAEAPVAEAADDVEGDPDRPVIHAGASILVHLGEGADGAVLRDAVATVVGVDGGAGRDEIGLHDVHASYVGVRGGGGDAGDVIRLADVAARHAAIGTGAGEDRVSIVDSTFGSLAVSLGGGNDHLSIQAVSAARALLAGGPGDADELDDQGGNTFGHLVVTGFEIPDDANTARPRPLARAAGLLARLVR